MADTVVSTAPDSGINGGQRLWGPYWITPSTGVIIFGKDTDDVGFSRTTDGGVNWTDGNIKSSTDIVEQIAVWFDQETPGDTGNILHVTYLDQTNGDWLYRTVDISDASLGTERTILGTVTIGTTDDFSHCAITKAVNGNLLAAMESQTEIECYRSTDGGVNWTVRADVWENAGQPDWVLLFPADVDAGDCCALYWDKSSSELTVKMYDDSADSWTETAILSSMIHEGDHPALDGAIRHSDNHLLWAAHTAVDDTGDDLVTGDITVDSIASPTVTAKTNIFTNQAESAFVFVFINQQNDDVYVGYLKGGTWNATVDAVYHLSDDGMATWASESAYSEATADDIRAFMAGRTVGDNGGRFQPVFYNDDNVETLVNLVNDTEIAAVGGGGLSIPVAMHNYYRQRQWARA